MPLAVFMLALAAVTPGANGPTMPEKPQLICRQASEPAELSGRTVPFRALLAQFEPCIR